MELLQANPHYSLIEDQKGATLIVSTQDLPPFPRYKKSNFGENTKLDEYDNLVHDASSSNPTVIIPRLLLPKEILKPDNSTDEGKIVVDSSATDGGFEVEEQLPNEGFDSPENDRHSLVRGEGR